MSVVSGLNAAFSGLRAFDKEISNVSKNIANVATVGYKRVDEAFKTLVKCSEFGDGVYTHTRQYVTVEGPSEHTGIATDMAVMGQGMFVVSKDLSANPEPLFTRAGAFRKDNAHHLVNSSGSYLLGWQYSPEAELDTSTLVPIKVEGAPKPAEATTEIQFSVNLDAGQAAFSPTAARLHFKRDAEGEYDRDSILQIINQTLKPSDEFGLLEHRRFTIAPNESLNLEVSDGLLTDQVTANYGGVRASRLINRISGLTSDGMLLQDALGVGDFESKIQTMEEGDGFSLIVGGRARVNFHYTESDDPDLDQGEFTNLGDILEILKNNKQIVSSSYIHDTLFVAPKDAKRSLEFVNLGRSTPISPSLSLERLYGSNEMALFAVSDDLAAHNIFGVGSSITYDPAAPFMRNIRDKDGLSLNLSNGKVYKFGFNALDPHTSTNPALTFNNLENLIQAINSVKEEGEQVFNAYLLDNKLNIEVANPTFPDPLYLTSIKDLNCTPQSPANFASQLRIAFDNSLRTDEYINPKTFVRGEVTPDLTNLVDGDAMRLRLSNGAEYVFVKGSDVCSYCQEASQVFYFDDLSELANAFNQIPEVFSSLDDQQISVMTTDPAVHIVEISDENYEGRSDIASILGLAMSSATGDHAIATVGDKIRVNYGSYGKIEIPDPSFAQNNYWTNSVNLDLAKINLAHGTTLMPDADLAGIGLTAGDKIIIKGYQRNGQELQFVLNYANATSIDITKFNTFEELEAKLAVLVTQMERIYDISGPEKLLIDKHYPVPNQEVTIYLDSGESYAFKFVPERPNAHNGEFNGMPSLVNAINELTGGALQLRPGLQPTGPIMELINTDKSYSKISLVEGLEKFGTDGIKSQAIDLKFTLNPNVEQGEFNNIATLRQAIKATSQEVVDTQLNNESQLFFTTKHGGIIKSIEDVNQKGISEFATNLNLKFIDVVASLGLSNVQAGSNRFASLSNLSDILSEKVKTEFVDENTLQLSASNSFKNFTITENNRFDLLNSLGLIDLPLQNKWDLHSAPNAPSTVASSAQLTGSAMKVTFDASYDPLNNNMASKKVDPDFTTNLVAIDSLGEQHSLMISFLRSDKNRWSVEIYTNNAQEVANNRVDGLIGYFETSFQPDGTLGALNLFDLQGGNTLRPKSDSLLQTTWSNGSNPSTLDLQLLTGGSTISQNFSDYQTYSIEHNGHRASNFVDFSLNNNGEVIAHYSNGSSHTTYQLPIATFVNADGLKVLNANLYRPTIESGEFRLQKPGENNAGSLKTEYVENSNVESSGELLYTIKLQHAYQANAKVVQANTKNWEILNDII